MNVGVGLAVFKCNVNVRLYAVLKHPIDLLTLLDESQHTAQKHI